MPKGFVKRDELELSLDSALVNASVARREVGAFAYAEGYDEEAVQAARAVVTEAFTNAAAHAYGEDGGKIEVAAESGSEGLKIIVRDYGNGIRPSPIGSPGHGRLGLLMIAALADSCLIRRVRPQGTEITAVIPRNGVAGSAPSAAGRREARSLVA